MAYARAPGASLGAVVFGAARVESRGDLHRTSLVASVQKNCMQCNTIRIGPALSIVCHLHL